MVVRMKNIYRENLVRFDLNRYDLPYKIRMWVPQMSPKEMYAFRESMLDKLRELLKCDKVNECAVELLEEHDINAIEILNCMDNSNGIVFYDDDKWI